MKTLATDKAALFINTCSFFEFIFNNSEETSILILDTNGTILDINRGFNNAYGYSAEELAGKNFSILFTEEDQRLERPQSEIRKAMQEGSAHDNNYLVHKNSELIWTQGETIHVINEKGENFLVKQIIDIHQQKLLEESLRAKEFSDKILESIEEPIVAIDNELKILKANKAFYDIFKSGISESELQSNYENATALLADTSPWKDILKNILPKNYNIDEIEAEYYFPKIGRKILSIKISEFTLGKENEKRIILVFKDITKVRQDEIDLKKQLNDTQQILESLPIIAFTSSTEGKIFYLNNTWENYTGQSNHNYEDSLWKKIIHPEDIEAVEKTRREIPNSTSIEVEIRLLRNSDKTYRWHLVRMNPVKQLDGQILFWVGTSTDIHAEKTKLESLEEILITSQRLAKIGSYELNVQNEKFTFSPYMYQIFGIDPRQEISRELMFSRVTEKDRQRVRLTLENAVDEMKEYSIEYMIEHPGGKKLDVLSRGKVFGDANGKPLKLIGTIIDISERKKIEEEVNKLQTILLESEEISNSGSYELDLQTEKVTYSPGLYKIYELNKNTKITLQTALDFIHPEDKEKAFDTLKDLETKKENIETEVRIITPSNQEKVFISKSKVIFGPHNVPLKLVGVIHDITDKKKIEKELIRANTQLENRVKERSMALIETIEELKKVNQDLDTFVYTASHDLKAPIHNIQALMHQLFEELSDESQKKRSVNEVIKMIDASITKFRQTLQDLSTTAKVQAGGSPLTHTDCQDVYNQVKFDLQEYINKFQATMTCDFSRAQVINLSSKNLRSIFYNLISNAIKYSDPRRRPSIHLQTSIEGEYILLQIKDNGLGIAEADKEKVYSMYQRLHHHVEGTGVGMAIVKRIVDNAGGRIEIDSQIGKGTTFRIFFKK